MATMMIVIAVLLVMAASGVVAAGAPRTLVQSTEDDRADHGHVLIGTGSRIS